MGSRIGVTKIIMHTVSIKVPNARSRRKIKVKMIYGLPVIPMSQFANICGTFCVDIIHPNGVATEIISIITPVDTTLSAVAFSIRDCLTQMPSILSANTPIPIGGGSSQSLLWCQIFADVLNHPILQLPTEETETLGDMIIAAQSVGIHDIDRYFGKKLAQEGLTIYPTPDAVSIYNEGFQKYKKLYQNVKALY